MQLLIFDRESSFFMTFEQFTSPDGSQVYMSHNMCFPTMWHFTCVESDEPVQPPLSLETSNDVRSVASA